MAQIDQAPSFVPPPQWLKTAHPDTNNLSWLFVISMSVLGAALRLFELTGPSLWVDELLTWAAVQPGRDLGFGVQFFDTIQGPLYLATIWPFLHWQDTALMLRLPAAIAGILTVPLFGLLAFRILGSRAARLSLLLFALNPFHIWYSQEGRGYAFLMLFAVVLGLVYLAMVRRGPSVGRAAAFAVTGAALVLSNISGLFLLMAMALTVLVLHRPENGRGWGLWLVALGLAVILVAPWLLKASGIWAIDRMVPGAGTGDALRGETTFSPLALPYSLYTFFFGYSLGPSLRELHEPDRMAVLLRYWPLLLACGMALGVSLLAGLARRTPTRSTLLIWLLVPVVMLVALALRNVKPWNPRYVSVVLPFLFLVVGSGLAGLPRRPGLIVTLGLVGLTLFSLSGYYGAGKYAKADLKGAAAWVNEAAAPNRVVLVPVVTSVYRYYDRGEHILLNSFGQPQLRDRAEAEKFVAESLGGHDYCRVILARTWYFDPRGHLLPALSRLGKLRLEQELSGVEIYAWERKSSREWENES